MNTVLPNFSIHLLLLDKVNLLSQCCAIEYVDINSGIINQVQPSLHNTYYFH
jgi:hypothetical protein